MAETGRHYEEQTLISSFWSWLILIVFSFSILGWGMFAEMIVRPQPPRWSFGQLPDTPGESVYSTVLPPKDVNVPYQMQRILDAQLPPGEIKQ